VLHLATIRIRSVPIVAGTGTLFINNYFSAYQSRGFTVFQSRKSGPTSFSTILVDAHRLQARCCCSRLNRSSRDVFFVDFHGSGVTVLWAPVIWRVFGSCVTDSKPDVL